MSQEVQVNQIIEVEEEEELGHEEEEESGHEEDFNGIPDFPPDPEEEEEKGKTIEEILKEQKRKEDEEEKKQQLAIFEQQKSDIYTNKFKPSTEASLRIIKDLVIYEVEKREGNLIFTAEPIGNDIFTWTIKVNRFIEGSELYKDIQQYKRKTGKNYVEFKALFPPNYPYSPPFIYCVQPRFQFHTGHITIDGSICHEIFSKDKWIPTLNIVSTMNNILVDIFDGNPRIDFSNDQPYSKERAMEAFKRVAKDHEWEIDLWFEKKGKS